MDISLDAYHAYIKSTQSEATAKKYRKGAELFLSFLNRNNIRDFSRMPRNTLQTLNVEFINRKYAPSTISLYTVGIKRYLAWCRDQGVELPHLAKASTPRANLRVKSILKRDDIRALFEACSELTEPTRTAIMLMPCCGLRSNEMAGLRLDSIQKVDIGLQDGTRKNCLALRVIGKYNKERYVPLLDEGQQIIAQYLTGWRRKRDGNWLFPSVYGGANHITPHSIWVSVAKVRTTLGIQMSPHTLRRTYATTLWQRKVADTTIAKILGHENLQTLYKHYLNMPVEDLTSAVHDKGGKLLSR